MSAVAMGTRGRSESIPGRAMPRWSLRHLLGRASRLLGSLSNDMSVSSPGVTVLILLMTFLVTVFGTAIIGLILRM